MNYPTDEELKNEILRWKLMGETEKIEAIKCFNTIHNRPNYVAIRFEISKNLSVKLLKHTELMLKLKRLIEHDKTE